LVIEGVVKEIRIHSMFVQSTPIKDQEDNLPTRFTVLVLEPAQAYTRLFRQKDGSEVDYTENNPRSREYVEPKLLSFDALAGKLGGGSGTALPNNLLDERRAQLHPRVKGNFEFWLDSNSAKAKEIVAGHSVRILTIGESIFIDDVTLLNAKLNIFKDMGGQGENLSGEYADAIMKHAEPDEDVVDTRDGVDEEEWSD